MSNRLSVLVTCLLASCVLGDDAYPTEATAVSGNIYNQAFDSSSWSSKWSISRSGSTLKSGYIGTALRTRIAAGSHYGSDMSVLLKNVGGEKDAVYFRYYLKLGANWNLTANTHTGKLPGLADLGGTNRCKGGKKPTSAECWSARMMWRPEEKNGALTGKTHIGYYVYHVDQPGNYGETDLYGLRFEAEGYTPLEKNQWYCIEGQVKMNTPNENDGVLKGWVNGRPALTRSDFRFRNNSSLHVERFWYDIFFGGKPAAPSTMDVHVDRLALSTTRVGCDSLPDDPMWEPGAEGEPFKDMPPGSFGHDEAIELKTRGITVGCRQGVNPMFCPRANLTRSQMAAFFVRALALSSTSADYFGDDTGSIFEANHNSLYESGITRGCNPPANDRFCGTSDVTRGQMAAFLSRAFKLPAATRDYFDDDDGTIFENDINKLIEAGISSGCSGGDSFCAERAITRAEMAIFLVRALRL